MKKLAVLLLTFSLALIIMDISFQKNKSLELIGRFGTGDYARKLDLYNFLQKIHQQSPALRGIPSEFPGPVTSPTFGYDYSYYGYSFKLPWRRSNRLQLDKDLSGVSFENGVSLVILNPEIQREQLVKMVTTMGLSKFGEIEINKLLNNQMSLSSFDFFRGVLGVQVKVKNLLSSYSELLWLAILTGVKVSLVGETPQEIYSFQRKGFPAFQIGNPSIDRRVSLYVFPEKSAPVRFMFGIKTPGSEIQAGINQVLTTLRPTPKTSAFRPQLYRAPVRM